MTKKEKSLLAEGLFLYYDAPMAFWKRLLGDTNATALKAAEPIVAQVNALEEAFCALSDTALKEKTAEFKKRLVDGLAGGVMLLLMYFALLFPENNPIIDDHIVYILVLALIAFKSED